MGISDMNSWQKNSYFSEFTLWRILVAFLKRVTPP